MHVLSYIQILNPKNTGTKTQREIKTWRETSAFWGLQKPKGHFFSCSEWSSLTLDPVWVEEGPGSLQGEGGSSSRPGAALLRLSFLPWQLQCVQV